MLSEDSQGLIKLANTFGAARELAPELKINVKFLTQFLPISRYTGGTAIVCEGEYRFQTVHHRVAVKTFTGKMGSSNHGMQSIHEAWSWRELSRLGNERIVRFFGLAENFPQEGDISLISEWMPEGDLRSFSRKHRGDDILLVNAVNQALKLLAIVLMVPLASEDCAGHSMDSRPWNCTRRYQRRKYAPQ